MTTKLTSAETRSGSSDGPIYDPIFFSSTATSIATSDTPSYVPTHITVKALSKYPITTTISDPDDFNIGIQGSTPGILSRKGATEEQSNPN